MRVAIIPARGGSRRLPRKNIRQFLGKPILAYSIETARRCGLFDRIIVTTDDEEIAAVAKEYGAEAWKRPEHLAVDEIGTQEVVGATLFSLGYAEDFRPDYACCIYATAPLLESSDIVRGYYCVTKNRDYAFSVGTSPLRDAGAYYWGCVNAFIQGRPLIGPDTAMVPLPEERVCDINTEEDFLRAEAMYAALHA